MEQISSVTTLSTVARMRLNARLMYLVREKSAIVPGAPMAALKVARVASQIIAVLGELGIDLNAKKREDAAFSGEPPEPIEGPRAPTAKFYEFDPDRTQGQRKKDNEAAMELLRKIDAGELDGETLTDEQKLALAKYSGTGGALVGADGKKGSAYEYYTPKPIAEGMWDLLRELGFKGGKVLDPSAGVGIFGGTAPADAVVDAVELNETSGRINALVNQGAGHSVEVSNYERIAAATPDEMYDAVITNVPFGSVSDRGGNELGDPRYQKEPLQNYFILRALEKLKPGGLAAFITPPRCVSGLGGKEQDLRQRASLMAEFMGAYRLPNIVFGTAKADTITDVIVLRKFSRSAAEKIAELSEQAPAKLVEANVLWPEFIGGKYFLGEGHRFILGEFVPKNPNDFRPVDRVVSDQSIPNIAKLLRKFPGSRIDWKLLDETETTPIVYQDGDTLTQKGQTLQLKDGEWQAIKSNEANAGILELGGKLGSPLQAFGHGVKWPQAVEYLQFMLDTSQAIDIPDWLRGAFKQLSTLASDGDRATYWTAGLVGMAVEEVMSASELVGTNYLTEYPQLSTAMARVATDARSCPGHVGGGIKSGMKALAVHYSKKNGYSGVWRGDVVTDAQDTRDADQKFEGVKYAGQGIWVDRDTAAGLYDDKSFDPIADPGWCIAEDGKSVARADDFFVGNYGDMIARLTASAKLATDPVIRGKFLAQIAEAERRVDRVDVSKVSFNLFSPYATLDEKVEFLHRFVSPNFAVAYDETTGKPYIACTVSASKPSNAEKLQRRLAQYLKNGTVTLGGAEVGDDREGIKALRDMVASANEQFNGWCRANGRITGRLNEAANDPSRLYFNQVEDESPIAIPGVSGDKIPHGYQNAFIRRMGRNFSGLNGFDVGLGKTLSALLSVAHVQSIGAKKKTAFVVPNSVLSNWRKEVQGAYTSTDDCLFVGLDINKKNGKAEVLSANYDRDLNIIRENRHSRIFMTMEAFQRLRLRDETIAGYETFLRSVDASFAESEDKKDDEVAKGKSKRLLAILTDKKSGATPYLEDLGIDSLVMDEAHAYKNSAETVAFKSAKFLALPESALRGIDAQAKAWFIRGLSPIKDGVLLLTATPITNSPLEIYSMLSLAVGRDRVNDMAMGIKGADQFMEVMCRVESEEDETVDGIVRDTRIFKGLENVGILRKALGDVAVIKTGADVGQQVKLPDADAVATPVALPDPPVLEALMRYKGAFRYAIDEVSGRAGNRGDKEAYEEVAAKFGEPMELIGHPFNLINKMTMLIIDPELDDRATFYQVSKAHEELADKAIAAFNAKKFTEERARPGPHTSPESVVGAITRKDGDDKITLIKVQVAAKRSGAKITIDTTTPSTQSAFEALAEKSGVDLDVTIPPKLAAMIENVIKEETNPRGIDSEGNHTPRVKQLIFCDILPLHNKIKRLLTKRAGIPSAAIAIITGQQNSKPDEILAVQDGFNADGADNKYRIVIANEKGEVGINLQKGTQAIHHLTIGWTPDSLTQRDGRGVRQGNKTERVNVYSYDADGTFDSHKRVMVSKKEGWIDQVMDVNGGDSVNVEGGMSREQIEALIDTVGDADAMTRLQERLASKEAEVRAAGVRAKQSVNIRTIEASRKFLVENDTSMKWVVKRMQKFYLLVSQLQSVEARLGNPKLSASALVKNESLKADLTARVNGARRDLEQSLEVTTKDGRPAGISMDALVALLSSGNVYKARDPLDKIAVKMGGSSYTPYEYKVIDASPIADDWQTEVDMSNAMVKESVASFAKHAKQAGGLPADVAEAFASGSGVMLDGNPVVDGAFTHDEKGYLGVFYSGGTRVRFWSQDGEISRDRKTVDLKKAEIVLPGSAGYVDCLNEAAAIDDTAAASGNAATVESLANTFTSMLPAVSQRRTNVTLVKYDASRAMLPAPHFPRVIDPANASVGQAMAAIVAAQASVIRSYEAQSYGLSKFVVDATQPIELYGSGKVHIKELLAFARAHSFKLKPKEADLVGTTEHLIFSHCAVKTGPLEPLLTGKTEDELRAAATAWVIGCLPDFDLSGLNPLALLQWSERYALEGAIKKAMLPPQVPVAEALAVVQAVRAEMGGEKPVADGSGIGDDDWVGISGNTRQWKDDIKRVATSTGKGFMWDGDTVQWNVQYKSWKALVEQLPASAKPGQLTLTEFSGKYPRGHAPK